MFYSVISRQHHRHDETAASRMDGAITAGAQLFAAVRQRGDGQVHVQPSVEVSLKCVGRVIPNSNIGFSPISAAGRQ